MTHTETIKGAPRTNALLTEIQGDVMALLPRFRSPRQLAEHLAVRAGIAVSTAEKVAYFHRRPGVMETLTLDRLASLDVALAEMRAEAATEGGGDSSCPALCSEA